MKDDTEKATEPRSRTLRHGLDPSEMGKRSGEARRAKAQAREQTAQENALTFRQRLGVSLSKLNQRELDQVVAKLAAAGNANALARLADQAFGRPTEAEQERPQDDALGELSREERATLRAVLEHTDLDAELEEQRSAAQTDPTA